MGDLDTIEYLRASRAEIEREIANIRDFSVFDFNYVPERPIGRPEMDHITRAILRYERSRIPTNLFIFGSRGCGKTMSLKYLERLFREEGSGTRLSYVNAREHNTSFKMLAHLVGATPRGVSLAELLDRFRAMYRPPTVVILDEIDFMSDKDPHKEILYLLSRCPDSYMLILLANNPKLLAEIDARSRSSLNPVPLHFKNYDAVQIQEILRQRAERGLNQYDHVLLAQIGSLVAKRTNADVRVAIKTLYYAATGSAPDVQESFDLAQRDLTADLICDLNYNNLLVLKAIAQADDAIVKDVYERYTKLCSLKGEKPFSYPHFYGNLGYLQSLGLILLSSTKVGRAYTNRISLLFTDALLQGVYEAKLAR